MDKYEIKSENYAVKKSHVLRNFLIVISTIFILAFLTFLSIFLIKRFNSKHISVKTLETLWNSSDEERYIKIYETGNHILQENPFNNAALIYYGYACFYLAVTQTDSMETQKFLDESISALRLSLYNAKGKTIPQIKYILGKAYFFKNKISENYYADLTIKYLTEAKEEGYDAPDIHEYLGMSYAALNMNIESIASFSEALLVRESDSLLVSIAEQYKIIGQNNSAKQYLFRVISSCENEEIIQRCHLLLGNIYLDEEKYDEALTEFETVLNFNKNSTDAYYGIGVIYEKQGNIIKARKEWRQVLKIQPNHLGALNKLSDNKK